MKHPLLMTLCVLVLALVVPQHVNAKEPAEEAFALYEAGDYSGAARIYEQIAAETSEAKYYFNAGLARQAAGHYAHALVHWQTYLDPRVNSEVKRLGRVQELIVFAGKKTTPVELTIEPVEARDGAAVSVSAGACGTTSDRPPLAGGAGPLHLDPGPWCAAVTSRGFQVGEVDLEVGRDGPLRETIRLEPEEPELPRDPVEVASASAEQQRVTVGEESGDRAVPVTVTVGPRAAIDAGARVRFVPTGTSEASVRLVQGRSSTWDVAPGAYTLEVAAPGFRDYAEAITVAPDLGAYEVELQPFRRINGVGIGLGVLSGVTLISGASILGVFAGRQYSKVLSRYFEAANANPVNHYNDAYALINRNLSIQHFGWVMIGGTVGVGISALTTIPTIAERPKRAAKIEMVTGAVITSAGLVSTLLTYRVQSRAFREDEDFVQSRQGIRLDDDRRDDLKLKQRLMNASAAAVGLGAGLLVGGVVMFIQHRRAAASPRVDVALAPGTLQLGLSGRF